MSRLWTTIETVNGHQVIPVCPKRSYRAPTRLSDCRSCRYLIRRTTRKVLCGYDGREEGSPQST